MNFKKRVNGSWTNTSHCIMGTSTDTITTLPAVLYPNDTTATVGLKGQTVQNGTPTPDNPIMPQGTGERTGNLINVPALSGVRWATQYPALLNAINSLPNGVYTMSISYELVSRNDVTDSSVCGWYISKDSRVLSNIRRGWETARVGEITTVVDTFTIDDNNRGAFTSLYLYGCGINGVGATGTAIVTNIMLNLGSTPLPYEPYGYKIPISSASNTTPVYLGEVETTRQIKKLVLDGTEAWENASSSAFRITITDAHGFDQAVIAPVYCSHYVAKSYTDVYNGNEYGISVRGGSTESTRGFAISKGEIATVSDFKSYLAAQYAAGTPVTIWYVLTTPETAVVNEPLMRIGDYADTVSGISIPTTAGANSFDVLTTLKPSEVTVNYKGWHPVADVHERESGAWT